MSNQDFCAEIIWKIQNFSCCWHKKNEAIRSPTFTLDILKNQQCYMELYPRGRCDNNSCFAHFPYKDDATTGFRIRTVTISFMKKETELNTEMDGNIWIRVGQGCLSFISHAKLLSEEKSYLPEDVLTMRCRIWPVSQIGSTVKVNKRNLRTCLEVEKFPFTWKIKNFSQVSAAAPREITIPCSIPKEGESARVRIFYLAAVEQIEIHISGGISREMSWKCVFKFADSEEHYLLCDEIISTPFTDYPNTIYPTFNFSYRPLINRAQILQNGDKYLINDTLSLDCQLVFISHELSHSSIRNITYSSINSVWFSGANAVNRTVNNNKRKWSTSCDNTSAGSSSKQLRLNIIKLYESGQQSDFSVQVESETIPVHSLILRAQSPVFERMLKCDMKESMDRSVKIEDMDTRTTRKMLDYIYAEEISDLDVELSFNLYYAGDKYEMTGLKRLASDFLKMHLSFENVYDVLVFADRYNDQELKLCVSQFMLENEKETVLSEYFKVFMKENAQLALETMVNLSKIRLE